MSLIVAQSCINKIGIIAPQDFVLVQVKEFVFKGMSVFLVHITSWGSKGPGVNLQEMNESQCNAL